MSRTLANQTVKKVGKHATVMGWVASRRDHGGLIFIDLRDPSGLVQIAFHPEAEGAFAMAEKVRDEYVIEVTGTVVERAPDMVNPNLSTGKIEITAESLLVLNTCKTLPFQIMHPEENLNEELRLKFRFLDLRREKMQHMLVRRHQMIKMIRQYMDSHGFIEITTPILTSSSPEGARDFLVPARLHPGKFYALPQAPQQFKQLLMVGGVPKYYQIAPCFRDEDPRADRSPGEFYQLDLEIAFAQHPEDVFSEMEPLFVELTEKFAGKKLAQKPFPRLAFREAMDKYGTDKPDLRFGLELINLTEDLKDTKFSVFNQVIKDSGQVKAITAPEGASFPRSQIDELTELVKNEGGKGLAYILFTQEGPKSPILKFLSQPEIEAIRDKTKAQVGDAVFFGAGKNDLVNKTLGKLRSALGDILKLKDPNIISWLWVTDFPMYEYNQTEKKIDFMHNPFSMPQGGLEALEKNEPLDILAHQYDIVANGLEISSGAIRNYNPEIMYKAFEIVGLDRKMVDEKFGAMIRAFEYGAPPHGGFAPGIDRMLMIFEDEPNIREVIAFPKNGAAEDLMMNAPGEVDEKQLKDLHIKLDLPKKKK
jgi:aspartyl-tRNA synthetase